MKFGIKELSEDLKILYDVDKEGILRLKDKYKINFWDYKSKNIDENNLTLKSLREQLSDYIENVGEEEIKLEIETDSWSHTFIASRTKEEPLAVTKQKIESEILRQIDQYEYKKIRQKERQKQERKEYERLKKKFEGK